MVKKKFVVTRNFPELFLSRLMPMFPFVGSCAQHPHVSRISPQSPFPSPFLSSPKFPPSDHILEQPSSFRRPTPGGLDAYAPNGDRSNDLPRRTLILRTVASLWKQLLQQLWIFYNHSLRHEQTRCWEMRLTVNIRS